MTFLVRPRSSPKVTNCGVMHAEGACNRSAGVPFGEALLGFCLLVFGELGLPTEFGAPLARCHPAVVGSFQDPLALVLRQCGEKSNEQATVRWGRSFLQVAIA